MGTRVALVVLLAFAAAAADRAAQDCEACGLLIWRMQTIIAEKAASLEDVKAAKEKAADREWRERMDAEGEKLDRERRELLSRKQALEADFEARMMEAEKKTEEKVLAAEAMQSAALAEKQKVYPGMGSSWVGKIYGV